MSKFVGTGPSSYRKRIYRAAVSQRLRNTTLDSVDTEIGIVRFRLSLILGNQTND